jgi:hypothetical protein
MARRELIRVGGTSKPKGVDCDICGTTGNADDMIQATKPDNERVFVCNTCWWARGAKPVPTLPEPPRVIDPRGHMSASKHATLGDALARKAKVAAYLGVLPLISPVDPSGPGPFFVIGDSPLVPGFDKVKSPNPLA